MEPDVIAMLLRPESPDVRKQLPTAEYEVKRLSELYGEPFILKLQGITYDGISDLKGVADGDLQIILEGTVSPNLRDSRLTERYGCATPAELVKAIFLPGEIAEIVKAVEKLCGYRRLMLKEVKKK